PAPGSRRPVAARRVVLPGLGCASHRGRGARRLVFGVRVVHLTRDFPPRINGGLSTAVGGMVRASVEAGLDCAVISFDAWRPNKPRAEPLSEERQAGAAVLRVSAPDQLDQARRWAGDAEVIHVHDALLWPLAREIPGRLRVFTVHFAQAV